MKKIIIFIPLIFILIPRVKATDISEIEKNIKIEYKWYKENITENIYHPAKEKIDGYIENPFDFRLGTSSEWNEKYCEYNKEYYEIEEQYTYKRVEKVRYLEIRDIELSKIKKIEAYYKGKKIKISERLYNPSQKVTIQDLNAEYNLEDLLFYIEAEDDYDILLYKVEHTSNKSIKKSIRNEKILIPDKTWLLSNTNYIEDTSKEMILNNDFIKTDTIKKICRIREKKTHRYKLEKEYYDNNYHEYIEGYYPDYNDYIIKYYGDVITQNIEIEKPIIQKQIQKEYIYLTNEDSNETLTSNSELIKQECDNNTKIEYIEKKIFRYIIPPKIYLLIAILLLIIIIGAILLIILQKKSRKKIN